MHLTHSFLNLVTMAFKPAERQPATWNCKIINNTDGFSYRITSTKYLKNIYKRLINIGHEYSVYNTCIQLYITTCCRGYKVIKTGCDPKRVRQCDVANSNGRRFK